MPEQPLENLNPDFIKDRLREIGERLIELDEKKEAAIDGGDVQEIGKIRAERASLVEEKLNLRRYKQSE